MPPFFREENMRQTNKVFSYKGWDLVSNTRLIKECGRGLETIALSWGYMSKLKNPYNIR